MQSDQRLVRFDGEQVDPDLRWSQNTEGQFPMLRGSYPYSLKKLIDRGLSTFATMFQSYHMASSQTYVFPGFPIPVFHQTVTLVKRRKECWPSWGFEKVTNTICDNYISDRKYYFVICMCHI